MCVAIMKDHQRALVAAPIGERIHVFVDTAVIGIEVVKQEIVDLGKDVPAVQQRRDLALVAAFQPLVTHFIALCPSELHPVALTEAFHLSMAEHRQSRKSRQQGTYAE